tara:strand:- start:1625 stop:2581 length:957 start_codon:yes stop_codon:yes gene_type:complete
MQINEVKFSKFLYEDDVYKIFTKNYAQSIILWYEFQRVWYHRAVTTFNDVDKFFILIYFFKKTFSAYNEHFVNKSFDEFYSQENLEIQKFNIVDLARELKFSKETVRRKLLELERAKIIIKENKNVIINFKSFLTRADAEVKGFARLISLFTKILYDKKQIEKIYSESEVEQVIKENFTRYCLPFLDFQIKYTLRQRTVFKDAETWFIWGLLVYNQTLNLTKKLKNSNTEIDFVSFTKAIPAEEPGLNAMTISDLSGIPRPTVLRKLNYLIKDKAVLKSKKSLYVLSQGKLLKKTEHLRIANNKELCSLITKMINLLI